MNRLLSHIVAPALAVLVIASTLACDSTGTKAESDFAFFAGDVWTVTSVRSGSVDLGLDAAYESAVTLRFFEEDGQNRFRLQGDRAEGSDLDVEGRVGFGYFNDFQLVSGDFAGTDDIVEIRYDIESSTQVKLFTAAKQNGAALVRVLLEQDLADVTLTLERSAPAS